LQTEGYSLHFKHRNNFTHRFGGIGVAIKNSLLQFVHYLKDDCECILWVKICKQFLKVDNDVYIGFVYIPPEGSRFYNNEMFDSVSESILNVLSKSDYVMLMGDFNARTGLLNDYCTYDDYTVKEYGLDAAFPFESSPDYVLNSLNLPLKRCSKDLKVNNHGVKLIDLCRNLNMLICNGRIGSADNIGNNTCKDKSVNASCHIFNILKHRLLSSLLGCALPIEINFISIAFCCRYNTCRYNKQQQ
jgi:hypothetical protein